MKKSRICTNNGARGVIFILDTTLDYVKLSVHSQKYCSNWRRWRRNAKLIQILKKILVVGVVNFLCVRMVEGNDYGI